MSFFALFLLLSFASDAFASKPVKFSNYANYSISFNARGDGCAIDAKGVKCWGDSEKTDFSRFMPTYGEISSIQVSHDFACAIVEGFGLRCWTPHETLAIGQNWEKPQQLTVFGNIVCAISDQNLKCAKIELRNYRNIRELFSIGLKNPKRIAISSAICALDDDGVKCFDGVGRELTGIPSLKNPVDITVGWEDYACADTEEGLVCWEHASPTKKIVLSPEQMKGKRLLGGYVCGPNSRWPQVDCLPANNLSNNESHLGVATKGPELLFLQSLASNELCAIDKEGFRCSGPKRYPEDLKFTYSNTWAYLKSLAQNSSPLRAAYFDLMAEFPEIASYQHSFWLKENYFALAIISPAILDADSAIFLNTIIPEWETNVELLGNRLGYMNIPDGLAKNPDTEVTRRLALLSLRTSLRIAVDLFSASQRETALEALRELGRIESNPMQNTPIQLFLVQLDALEGEKAKLRASRKTAFIAGLIDISSEYLRQVAR